MNPLKTPVKTESKLAVQEKMSLQLSSQVCRTSLAL